MRDDHKVDRSERGIRFGCGLVVGLVLGFFFAIRAFSNFVLPAAVAAGLALGLLSAVYGDRFWYALLRGFSGLGRWW